MTIQILTPISTLLKHQSELPEDQRQSSIMLRFASPVVMSMTSDFYRIHLTPEMKEDGRSETGFYRPEIFQPSRMQKTKLCTSCKCEMVKVLISTWKCQNAKCNRRGAPVESGPTRGVIAVDVPDNAVTDREEIDATRPIYSRENGELIGHRRLILKDTGLPMKVVRAKVDRCILRLDRRYDELVLAAIYRTAGAICDQYGWVLL